MLQKINLFLEKNIHFIIFGFFFLQPFLDVFAGINQHFLNLPIEFNVIFRILFLLFAIFYLLFLNQTKYKRISLLYLISIFIYFILYSFTILYVKDMNVLFYEFKNMILSFYLPILLLFFFNISKQYSISFSLKYFIYIFAIYILFIAIPNLFGIAFDSYTQGKIGSSGWFNSANSVSSILSILFPFLIVYFRKNKSLSIVFIFFLFLYAILSMGTKVPILSLIIIFIINLFYFVILWFKKKQYHRLFLSFICTIIIFISMIFIIPKTSFYKNIKIHAEFLGIHSISEVITNPHYIDRFIFSDRLTFLNHTKDSYIHSKPIEKFIGIGYIENYSTDQVSTKMIEIDYFDIFFRHGIIGFILYFIPIIILTYNTLRYLNFRFDHINILISIILIYVLALFSGHIFIVPSTSIFVAFILNIKNFKNNEISV